MQATLYLQHSTLPSGARTLKAKPKTLQHSTLPLGSGTLKEVTLYLQHSTLPSGARTLKAKPKTLQHSTLPLGSGTLKDTPSTLQHSTLPPGSGTLKVKQRTLQHSTLPSESGTLKDTPRTLHQGTFSAIPSTTQRALLIDKTYLQIKRVAATRWRSTTALLARKAAGLKTTKTTRTFTDRQGRRYIVIDVRTMSRVKVLKTRAEVATKVSKARAGLKFLVYNEATCSFVSAG